MVAEMGSEAHSPPSVAVGSQSPDNTSAATTISYPPRPEQQQEGERPRKDLAKMDVTQFISKQKKGTKANRRRLNRGVGTWLSEFWVGPNLNSEFAF